jgi:hypothetical protein
MAVWRYGGMAVWRYGGNSFFYARKQSEGKGKHFIVNVTLFTYLSVLIVWLAFLVFA